MIQINNLTKSFRIYRKPEGLLGSIQSFYKREYITKSAVEKFSTNIQKGEIVALLGPNGAGKTTIMKMLSGIIVPSSGSISVSGHAPAKREIPFRKKIALVMGQKGQLWWDLPAMDALRLLQSYYELSDSHFKKRVGMLSEILQVKDLLHTHIRKLSLGERMKLELMASLLHDPEVLLLDEPTIGLDLIAQENMRNFIRDYHQEHNTTIILTSHYMADVHALCKRLLLIIDGKKSFDGPLLDFENVLGNKKSVSFTFDQQVSFESSFLNKLEAKWSGHGHEVEIQINQNEFKEVCKTILDNYPVININTEKMPIEKVMKQIIENPNLLNNDQ